MGMSAWTVNELMVAAIARELRDGELVFVGVGTAGRAYTLAVGIPLVAARLAQLTHAPDLVVYWGNLLAPDLDRRPKSWLQDTFTTWPGASAPPDTGFKLDMLTKGDFDVSFESAAQVDRFGNLNITLIGDPDRPRTRLVGCLAQPEHLAFVRRPIIVVDLKARTFVPRVDFLTSVGHLDGGTSRDALGLPGPGPERVITDKATFVFDPESKRMTLATLHPGVSEAEVFGLMGFRPEVAATPATTPEPSPEEVRLIRQEIDPGRVLLRV
jgi:glutaconate CoA-transferase, subunit B